MNPAPRRAAQRRAAPRGVNSDVEIELRARARSLELGRSSSIECLVLSTIRPARRRRQKTRRPWLQSTCRRGNDGRILGGDWFERPPPTVAPPGFCDRGGSEVWVYRGSRVRSPPVPVVLSVHQRCSLLDGLAMYLSCDTKKFHDNESTHISHNFWTSTHRGKLPHSPPWRRHWLLRLQYAPYSLSVAAQLTPPMSTRRHYQSINHAF